MRGSQFTFYNNDLASLPRPSVLFWLPCWWGWENKLCATCRWEGNEGITGRLWSEFCKQTLFPRIIALRGCMGITAPTIRGTHTHTLRPESAVFLCRDLQYLYVCSSSLYAWLQLASGINLSCSFRWPLRVSSQSQVEEGKSWLLHPGIEICIQQKSASSVRLKSTSLSSKKNDCEFC